MIRKRKWFRQPTPFQVVLLLVLIAALFRHDDRKVSFRKDKASQIIETSVTRVLDGDTVDCSDGTRVRLLGIDAPEIAHGDHAGETGGEESANWLRERIQGQPVTLIIGPEPTDKYGRTLAWIYDDKDQLINQKLLEAGQAKLVTAFGLPQNLEPDLRRAAAEAKVHHRGIWAK